jgi:hypothetical protein
VLAGAVHRALIKPTKTRPISGLPEIGDQKYKSAIADLFGGDGFAAHRMICVF